MARARLATVWMDGCSGCHMSLLDLDEGLLELFANADLVWSPLVDVKEFPEGVDLTLVEGAVGSVEDEHRLKVIRSRTRLLVAVGDCAVTGNVPALRNQVGPAAALKRAYVDQAEIPGDPLAGGGIPALRETVVPLHRIVAVDGWLPGCPPAPALLRTAILDLLAGRTPDLTGARFG